MIELFSIRLREVIREDKSGVYGIGAGARVEQYPKPRYVINIMFGCNPDRVNELIAGVKSVIEELKNKKTDDSYMTKVKEIQKREFEVNLKENNFWLNAIYEFDFNKNDMKKLLSFNDKVDKLTADDIQKAAKKYLTTKNYAEFVLYPEE